MGRLCPIVVVALALSFAVCSLDCSAASPHLALKNPALLREMDGRQIWYGSYDFWLEQVSVIYVEYDEVAQGCGAFLCRFDQNKQNVVWSYAGARSVGNLGIGLGVHRSVLDGGDWWLDLGLAYDLQGLLTHAAIRQIPITRLGKVSDEAELIIGAEIELIRDYLTVGVDSIFADKPRYQPYAIVSLIPELECKVFGTFDPDWSETGSELTVLLGDTFIELEYRYNRSSKDSQVMIGVGQKF